MVAFTYQLERKFQLKITNPNAKDLLEDYSELDLDDYSDTITRESKGVYSITFAGTTNSGAIVSGKLFFEEHLKERLVN